MIRAVLDTNTIVSGIFKDDTPPGLVLRSAVAGRFHLVTSRALLEELHRVLAYPRVRKRTGWPMRRINRFVSRLYLVSEVVEPTIVPKVVVTDPSDDHVLACAVTGSAQFIVSGDQDLLAIESQEGIRIITPQEFLGGNRSRGPRGLRG